MEIPFVPTATSHFFTSLRTRLHYLDWGNPTAPTVILIHGGFDHGRSWDWTARALASDYHVVAPDLRGHGDSGWSSEGNYLMTSFVYDLGVLIELLDRSPVMIVGHSLGGAIGLRFAGMFPDKVQRIVAIEGLGQSPQRMKDEAERPAPDVWAQWLTERRDRAGRARRSHPSIEAAVGRMRERNEHLTVEQALHLTHHGVNRNEDGSFSWKFDPFLKLFPPQGGSDDDLPAFWERIRCPTLLCLGQDSWASNPVRDGRMAHFHDARLSEFADAGHWLHHDQFENFMAVVRPFLRGEAADRRTIVG